MSASVTRETVMAAVDVSRLLDLGGVQPTVRELEEAVLGTYGQVTLRPSSRVRAVEAGQAARLAGVDQRVSDVDDVPAGDGGQRARPHLPGEAAAVVRLPRGGEVRLLRRLGPVGHPAQLIDVLVAGVVTPGRVRRTSEACQSRSGSM